MPKPLHVPLADVMKLARILQWDYHGSEGPGISSKQIKKAEAVMRKLIREHLDGKWTNK